MRGSSITSTLKATTKTTLESPSVLPPRVQRGNQVSGPASPPQFVPYPPEKSIGRFVLQLVTGDARDVWHSVGTAALLRPGLALTAGHVIEQCARVYPFGEKSLGHV